MALDWGKFNLATGGAVGLASNLPWAVSRNMKRNMVNAALNKDETGIICTIFMAYLADEDHLTVNKDNAGAANIAFYTDVTGTANAEINAANMANITDADEKIFVPRLYASLNPARQWFVDLIACEQVKPLKTENITAYFASIGCNRIVPSKILTIISTVAKAFPKLVGMAGGGAQASKTDFIRYHTSATSTPMLVKIMIDGLGPTAAHILNAAQLTAVAAAFAAMHDKTLADAIEVRTIALTHAYLKVFKLLPDEWKQGAKAKAAFPASSYAIACRWFSKFFAITSDATDIDAATTLAQLEAALPASMKP